MDFVGNKVLVSETDEALRQRITEILAGAGYEVFVNDDQGMKSVLTHEPDVIVLGADPPNFDCCQLLSEIKGSDKTSHIRVVILAPGGPAERSFGLDLGADDADIGAPGDEVHSF
jgi:DNA-binding response OmpR family regulator